MKIDIQEESLLNQRQKLPLPGSLIHGFRVKECGNIKNLNGETLSAVHEVSGADLYYIQNDDKELSFTILYRTPYLDDADINHVLEHGVISSSKKYPSKNVFFDMVGKTYNTYLNALTSITYTAYPLASQSSEQLLKMMDVYLSCLTEPEILENENIFKREGLRLELHHKDEPITMKGTVFTEDFSSLNDITSEALKQVLQALYPGEQTVYINGRAHLNFEELTYEKTVELFKRYYSFDNCLIILYGNMEYEEFLEFLDREYLSRYPKKKDREAVFYEEASVSQMGRAERGMVESICKSPAYQGDQTEGAGIINYAFDLSGLVWEDRMKLDILSDMISNENSGLHKNLKARGIYNQCSCGQYIDTAKPVFSVVLEDADKEQRYAFKEAVDELLKKISTHGVSPEIFDLIIKKKRISSGLSRNGTNIGVNMSAVIGCYWAITGKADYCELEEKIFSALNPKDSQKEFKRLAEYLLTETKKVLAVTEPEAGLAEEIQAGMERYLAEKKASMSEAEIQKLIEETCRFEQWNESQESCQTFTIPVKQLPKPEPFPKVKKEISSGISWYQAEAASEETGALQIYIYTGGIKEEDLYYLPLFELAVGELQSGSYNSDEMRFLIQKYLYGIEFDETARFRDSGEQQIEPFLQVSFYGLAEDAEKSMELFSQMIRETGFDDIEAIKQIIKKYAPLYNMAQSGDAFGLVKELVTGYLGKREQYKNYMAGQGYYRFLKETEENMDKNPEYGRLVAEKLKEIQRHLYSSWHMMVSIAASEKNLPVFRQAAEKVLQKWPSGCLGEERYLLEPLHAKTAVIIESPDQYHMIGSCWKDMDGRYVPFISMISDKYIVQKLRFEMGAYSALAYAVPGKGFFGLYSCNDPNGKESLKVMESAGDYLEGADITKEELDGYILSAYSDATLPMGAIQQAQAAIAEQMRGEDPEKRLRIIEEMKLAEVKDKKEAAEIIKKLIQTGAVVSAGNKAVLERDRRVYERVVDYRGVILYITE